MKKVYFNSKCPLEIGDTVAIFPGEAATLYYLPDGVRLDRETAKIAEIHTVTEIAAIHYIKAQKAVFAYQLDNTEDLVTYKVKIPIVQMQRAMESGNGVILP